MNKNFDVGSMMVDGTGYVSIVNLGQEARRDFHLEIIRLHMLA